MTITTSGTNPTKVEATTDTTTTITTNTFEFADSIDGQVDSGVTVSGFGLEFISTLPNSMTTTTTIQVTNDGTVTSSQDNNTSALELFPIATGDFGTFTYSGSGSVTNTGNGGALRIDNQGAAAGTGEINITISGTSTISGSSTGDGIEANSPDAAKVTVDSGGLVEGMGAVEFGGTGASTVDNTGTITGGSAGIQSAQSEILLDNETGGMISATGTNASAIIAGESPTPGGSFSGSNAGTITSQGSAITSAGTITITSNSGMISSTATNVSFGNAISTVGDVTVTANTGTISGGFTAIQAGGNADVTNSDTISGGAAAGEGFGISASGSAKLVNNQNATVSGNAGAVQAGTDATVMNSGTLSSGTGDTISAGSGTAKVTNNSTGMITSTGSQVFTIAGNTVNLDNSGTVQASGGSGSMAVFSADLAPINVTNSGTIEVTGPVAAGSIGGSIAIESTASTGTNMIGNSGTISSNGASGAAGTAAAIVVFSDLTLTNSPDMGSAALIQDTGAGSVGVLADAGSGAVGITNDGTISGDGNGINTNTTGLTTIANTGTISNTTGGGATPGDIRVNVASITNMSTGSIEGADFGILFRNSQTTGSTIFNAGTISGATAAIQFSSASTGNTLTLGPGFTITGNVTQGAGNILQLGGSSGTGTFNVSNIGTQYQNFTTFNKVDTSTWTLTGTGTQAWTVEKGTLQVDGTIGDTTVQSTGILDGTGTTGAVTVDSGGTLSPGDAPGTITAGNLDLQTGSTLSIGIEGTSPGVGGFGQVMVNGSVTLAGTLSTTLLNGFAPQAGESFEIINNEGNSLVSGTFAGLAQGASFTQGSATYSINYDGGDGNDVVLTVTGNLTATLSSNSPVQGTPISVASVLDNGNDVSGTATYQWMVNDGAGFVDATGNGATAATYTPTEGDEGGQLEVVVSNPADGRSTTVVATNTVADSADLTGTLSTNSPVQGTQISVATASDGGTNVLNTATYQWMVNTGSGFVDATGTGATTATYTPVEADEGGTLEVVITLAGDDGNAGNTETTTVVATNTVADSSDLTATLSSNSPVQGSPISVATASDGGRNVLNTATYQWMVNTGGGFVDAAGTGATTATYTPAEADEGGQLEVVVSVTDPGAPGGTETTTVVATNTVAEIADLTATLSSNSPVQGSPISVATASDGGTNVLATANYQWKVKTGASFVNATGTGATTATYTPTEGDEGGQLEVVVSVTDPGAPGNTETTTVVATNTVADSADLTATFSTNSPMQGSPISVATVTDGGVDAMAGALFQWKVNTGSGFVDASGNGATSATYTPTEGDEGGTLEVVIAITGDLGNTGTIEAATVTVANPVADSSDLTATLSSNSPVQGSPISVASASDGGTNVLNTATYQWMVNNGSGFVDATGTGATTATYTPTEADEGGKLEVVISVTDAGNPGNTETTTVVATSTVAEIADLTATLSSPSAAEGVPISVATASDGGTNVLATANYQWKVNTGTGFVNATGTGATTATYTPTEGDEGGKLEVVVSLADAGSTETTTLSAGTVQESPTENASFTVSGLVNGRVVPNDPITATVTEPDAPTTGITYTWKVNGTTELTGLDAAADTFTPQASEAGKPLTLTVSFTDTHGFAETGTASVGSTSTTPFDLNGDGISDLVFQNNGTPGIWLWNGSAPTAETALTDPGPSWHIITSRDVNGDGKADLIWQNDDGTPGIWLMNGTTPIAEAGLSNPGTSWHLVAAGDVNGDGNADLIWQDNSGTLGVWEMNGTTPIAEAAIGNPGANWKVVGSADFNGDGKDDILLQNSVTGNLMIDLMNGTSIASTVSITVGDPSWHAVSTGEFNGQAEIAWQNNNGQAGIWLMNGTTPVAEAGLSNPGAGWQLLSIDHFTPNGQADLLFQNTSGPMQLWEMNGTNVAAMVNLPNPTAAWPSVNGHPFATG